MRVEKYPPTGINMLFRLVLQPGFCCFLVILLLVASVNTTGSR